MSIVDRIKSFICYDGCPAIFDASCVQYNGPDLDNLFNATTGTMLDIIIQSINNIVLARTPFSANSTNSIYGVAGGSYGHSPKYNLRLNPSPLNMMSISEAGVFVNKNSGGDGKVKVDVNDIKDYLEDQFGIGDDGEVIVTITPTKIAGKIQFVPTINIAELLNQLEIHNLVQFCQIISPCIPHTIISPGCTCNRYAFNGIRGGEESAIFNFVECGNTEPTTIDPKDTIVYYCVDNRYPIEQIGIGLYRKLNCCL